MNEVLPLPARAAHLLLVLAARLPLPVLQFVGTVFGWLSILTRSRAWLVCRENIATCFPELDEAGQRRLARQAMCHAGRTLAETAIAWTRGNEACLDLVVAVDGDDEVFAIEGPIVFVLPHLGNWEILNHYLGRHFGLTHMYEPLRSRSLNALVLAQRARTGTRFVPAGRAGIRAQVRQLRQGRHIGSMPDQEPDVRGGEFATFFGQQCLTGTVVPALVARSRATPVIAWCERTGRRGFRIRLKPLPALTTPTQLNAAIESAVRQCPAQYLWTYKRFRTRPPGEAERYQFRQHPVRVMAERTACRLLLQAARGLPPRLLWGLGALGGDLAWRLRLAPARIARTNTGVTGFPLGTARASLQEDGKNLAETARVWSTRGAGLMVHNAPDVDPAGCLVLTPALGSREVLMRYLASRGAVVDYYHPNKNSARDDLIREARYRFGIRLAPETGDGEQRLASAIRAGGIATIAPDQQPRLRGGEFVPFFGVPALTTLTIPRLLRATGAPLLMAAAWRDDDGHVVTMERIEYRADATDPGILEQVNGALEALVARNPSRYRWSARRFNIRPAGERKLYR